MSDGDGMQEAARRCELCSNYCDGEDLFCANCGRELPEAGAEGTGRGGNEQRRSPGAIEEGFVGFDCETCGASLTYDAEKKGLRCAFCGSVTLRRQANPTGRIRAEHFLPFAISRADAERAFGAWIDRGFFRPFGVKREARVVSMQAVYVPFWRFRARTHTYYTGDSSRTPAFARADWCPVAGEREGEVEDVLVPASGSLLTAEVEAISPFDFTRRQAYEREALRDHAVEDFGLGRRGARARARAAMLAVERAACAALIPGRSRNVHVNTLFTDLRSAPVLLPVWINAYRYREETYRFIVNGQTGRLGGRAPFSWAKLALVVGVVLLLGIALVAIFGG